YTDEYLYVRADRVLGIEWLDVEWPITALTALAVSGTLQSLWQPGSPGSPEDRDVFVLEARDPKHGRDRLFKPGGWPIGAVGQRTYTAGEGGEGGRGGGAERGVGAARVHGGVWREGGAGDAGPADPGRSQASGAGLGGGLVLRADPPGRAGDQSHRGGRDGHVRK